MPWYATGSRSGARSSYWCLRAAQGTARTNQVVAALAQRLRHGFGADTFVNAGTCDMGKSASFDVNAAKGCAYQLQSACLVRCSCACTDASPAGNGTAARTQNSLSPILCVALIFDNSHSMLRDKAVRCTLKTSPGSDTALSDTGSGSNRRTTAMF